MKKVVIALLSALVLVGCTPAQSAPVDTPTIQMPMQDNDYKFDQAFVGQYEAHFGYKPTNEIVQASREVGLNVCKALRAGATATQVVTTLLEATQPGPGREGVLIAAGVGVGVYCPQYIKEFK